VSDTFASEPGSAPKTLAQRAEEMRKRREALHAKEAETQHIAENLIATKKRAADALKEAEASTQDLDENMGKLEGTRISAETIAQNHQKRLETLIISLQNVQGEFIVLDKKLKIDIEDKEKEIDAAKTLGDDSYIKLEEEYKALVAFKKDTALVLKTTTELIQIAISGIQG